VAAGIGQISAVRTGRRPSGHCQLGCQPL